MKSKWLLTLIASVPMVAATLVLQSCAGVGGPLTENPPLPSVTEAFLALLTPEQRSASYIGAEACSNGTCHGGREATVYQHWKETKHGEKGVSCERCHGPGSAHAAAPETAGLILKLPESANTVICAQCHGPTQDQFNLSGHNLLVASPVERGITDPNGTGRGSRCITCHSGLVRIEESKGVDVGGMTDARIRELCNDTLTKVPHVANCSSCHDPHRKTGFLTDTGKEVQMRKQAFNTDTVPVGPGAVPASTTTYAHICAQCHNGRGANPADSVLNSSTSRPNMHDSNQFNMLMGFGGVEGDGPVVRNTAHATAPGQCSKCHMPDSNHSFKAGYDKGCAPCHSATDAANRISVTRNDIIDKLLALRNKMGAWAQGRFSDSDLWDYPSLLSAEGKTAPTQSQVPIEVKRARHNYYFVIRSGDYGAHNAPYARHLITIANQNMDALMSRSPSAAVPTSNLSRDAKFQILEADRKRAHVADMSSDMD